VTLHTIEEAIADIKQGKMVILVDDEDRENEGDLTMAAEKVTPEAINFMATHGRGLICLSLTAGRLAELRLPQMVEDIENTSGFGTAFTVSIEARQGVTTGISAADRATTILTAINPKTRPEDLVRPGHVFPLRARAGGVLERPGQTEGSVDLARLAGLTPAGVICEIMNDDGTMARLPQLLALAARFGLKIVTIKALVQYRMQHEALVRVIAETRLPTRFGTFRALVYEHDFTKEQHLVLVYGRLDATEPLLVRVHFACLTGDVLGSFRCDCGEQLRKALQHIAAAGAGVLIYLHHEGHRMELASKIRAIAMQDAGRDTVQVHEELGLSPHQRDYGNSAQILASLGARRLRLITNNPNKIKDLSTYGFDIVERIPIQITPRPHNVRHLRAKHEKLGHYFDIEDLEVRKRQEWW
jgi:3,4-dihydroxy 2-butanone 4-phosphate synthase/GTP cyclohydrolase II